MGLAPRKAVGTRQGTTRMRAMPPTSGPAPRASSQRADSSTARANGRKVPVSRAATVVWNVIYIELVRHAGRRSAGLHSKARRACSAAHASPLPNRFESAVVRPSTPTEWERFVLSSRTLDCPPFGEPLIRSRGLHLSAGEKTDVSRTYLQIRRFHAGCQSSPTGVVKTN